MLTRRQLLKTALLGSTMILGTNSNSLFGAPKKRRFRYGACDWSLGKNGDLGAFEVAKKIGLDGIMVSMGGAADNLKLRQRPLQDSYLAESKRTGIKISSLAIGELNQVPYKSDPRTEEWVWDSIDTAHYLKAPVILLAFFDKNDLRNDEAGKKEVIRRLKKVAGKAEQKGIILGIESYLNADEHLEIIEKVGSKNVKVYLDCRNTADAGFDVFKEVRKLGKENICELHMKENGFLLGKGTLDWPKIADMFYEMQYYGDGWMQLEWAIPSDTDLVTGYQQNLQFLKGLFNKEI